MAIFGHEPDLSQLASHLLRSTNSLQLKKAGVALLELEPGVPQLEPGSGQLKLLLSPKVLLRAKVTEARRVASICVHCRQSDERGSHRFRPGLEGVPATQSAISNIDGQQGILSYRGYRIEDLAAHSTFLETAYLLIWGELPSAEGLREFQHDVQIVA